MSRVCIIGLDCLTPQLTFGAYWDRLPNLQQLARQGHATTLLSCIPPITVPAWSCMVTGHDPGALGVYGFRGRADHSYERRRMASALDFNVSPLWTLLQRAGLTTYVLGVPQTYPAMAPAGRDLNKERWLHRMVTGCLTPGADAAHAYYPPSLRYDVSEILAGKAFLHDVAHFRSGAKDQILRDLYTMTAQRFAVARAWLHGNDAWDFFMMVDMGPDRLHHAFWADCVADHPAHRPGNPWLSAMLDYYTMLDGELGRLVAGLREDDTVLVVSDHGAQTMLGGVAINDWLMEQDFLRLREAARHRLRGSTIQRLEPEMVDWANTRAWGDGGYVGRIYLNIQGREPEGTVAAADAPTLLARLSDDLRSLPATHKKASAGAQDTNPHVAGRRFLDTRVYRPDQIYHEAKGVPPDLIVAFDNLRYRALGTIGHANLFVTENDTGCDGANHASEGVLLMRSPHALSHHWANFTASCGDKVVAESVRNGPTLYDIAPTVLTAFGLPVAASMQGCSLIAPLATGSHGQLSPRRQLA